MPAAKVKAGMACTLEEREAFLERQADIKADCQDLLRVHIEHNPDVEWKPEDGAGQQANLRREKARLSLVLQLEFDEETGRPRFPPPNTRLSDEWVYLAIKHMKCVLRGQRYPYDFDKKGCIDPDRVPSGPAPIIWAHGLPFFPIYKGYYILCGRDHAECMGWLINEKTAKVMKRSPHFSIGAVVAPKSAVDSDHSIDRQLMLHQPYGIERDLRFKARDVVSANHHQCAVLPRLNQEPLAMPLWKVRGYNARCGPLQPGMYPTTMRQEYFMEHGLETDEEYAYLARIYRNIYSDGAEEPEDEPSVSEDASTGDASTGDASTGDASTGDASTGDASMGDDNNISITQPPNTQDTEMNDTAPIPEAAEQDKAALQEDPRAIQLLPQNQVPYGLAPYDPFMIYGYEPQEDTQRDDLLESGFEFSGVDVHPAGLNTAIDMSEIDDSSRPATPEEDPDASGLTDIVNYNAMDDMDVNDNIMLLNDDEINMVNQAHMDGMDVNDNIMLLDDDEIKKVNQAHMEFVDQCLTKVIEMEDGS
ncbi:unnamed protein product [Penicillium bialowiezense]